MNTQSLLPVFGDYQLEIERAEGSRVWDTEGREYIDLLQGIAVNCLGHSNPEVIEAITTQAKKVMHHSNFFSNPQTERLAEKLAELAGKPDAKVFFANSGTEANEAALKLVKKFSNSAEFCSQNAKFLKTVSGEGKTPEKTPRIIALTNSFHGRSLGALSLTSKAKYREPFAPLIAGVEFIEANNLDALEDCFSEQAYSVRGPVAGMFIECIQGEAGVKPLTAQFIARARQLTKERGALLVVDEVQTGIGRTGSWFAFQNPLVVASARIVPDVVTSAKSLGGGFPIGAMITLSETASSVLAAGDHGTTFGGNPLAAATSLKVLEIIKRDKLMERAGELAVIAAREVMDWNDSRVVEVRGVGALLAIELDGEYAAEVAKRGLANAETGQGVILNAVNPSSIRLAPALNITDEEFLEGLRRLRAAL